MSHAVFNTVSRCQRENKKKPAGLLPGRLLLFALTLDREFSDPWEFLKAATGRAAGKRQQW
jgi:hypothetical protein